MSTIRPSHASPSSTPLQGSKPVPVKRRTSLILPTRADLSSTNSIISNEQIVESLKKQSHLSTLTLSPRTRRRRPHHHHHYHSGDTTTNQNETTEDSIRSSISIGGEEGRRRREKKESTLKQDHSYLDQDQVSQDSEEEDDEEDEWTIVDRMRNWRNDAMTQHLYATAEFWGSKILAMTGNPNDAFWLAQTYFLTHQYNQAEKILTSSTTTTTVSSSSSSSASKLTDISLACRYLTAQCQVRLGKWEDALEMVGKATEDGFANQYRNGRETDDEEEKNNAGDGGIKLTASTAHLRGLIHLHLGSTDQAKEAFMYSLTKDVKCFESFQVLVGSEMMTNDEEWEFIQNLPYFAQTRQDADFVKMMYTVRLKKINRRQELTIARQRLTDEYGLGQDPDVLFGLADELYTSLKFAECYKLTSKILSMHSSHRPTLPIHLSCMHHLPQLRSKLYLLAHELVENEPDDCISWYAVGLWYFSGKRWEESRRFFGKSVLIDSRFGPSWLAFAHSYAFEGEHDQAITAYSTAMRHSQGSHLPSLFIGMQHLGLMNIVLAKEYLTSARDLCKDDPLANNELGVAAFHLGKYDEAVQYFEKALVLASKVQASPASWATTHLNLGHSYRKLGQFQYAHTSFRLVISLDPRSSSAYSALGLIEHQLGQFQESISRYHEALSITPGDPITCNLLKLVLEESSSSGISAGGVGAGGLSEGVLRGIDEMVDELERDVLLGKSPKIVPVHDGNEAEEKMMQDDQGQEETMDMST